MPSPHLRGAADRSLAVILFLRGQIKGTEDEVLKDVKLRKEFAMLLTVPGIGKILGLTIMLEVGDIRRFKGVRNYSSYCRCVKAERWSAGKKKGKGNENNGNTCLAWASVEAAHFARRYHAGTSSVLSAEGEGAERDRGDQSAGEQAGAGIVPRDAKSGAIRRTDVVCGCTGAAVNRHWGWGSDHQT